MALLPPTKKRTFFDPDWKSNDTTPTAPTSCLPFMQGAQGQWTDGWRRRKCFWVGRTIKTTHPWCFETSKIKQAIWKKTVETCENWWKLMTYHCKIVGNHRTKTSLVPKLKITVFILETLREQSQNETMPIKGKQATTKQPLKTTSLEPRSPPSKPHGWAKGFDTSQLCHHGWHWPRDNWKRPCQSKTHPRCPHKKLPYVWFWSFLVYTWIRPVGFRPSLFPKQCPLGVWGWI